MNNTLKTALSLFLIFLILKYVLKLAGTIFSGIFFLAIILLLIGLYQQIKNK